MFNIGLPEFLALGVLALLVFGPDRLPKAAQQVGRALRQLRRMADSAKHDLQDGLGPEFKDFDVNDLNPRQFVRKHFWEDEDEASAGSGSAAGARRSAARLNGKRPPFDSEAT